MADVQSVPMPDLPASPHVAGREPEDRRPPDAERAKESAVLLTMLLDAGILSLRVPVALLTGSLILLGGSIRGLVLLVASVLAYLVMRAVHRRRLTRYEFGVGKIEQLVSVLVGLSLVASGLWAARNVVETILEPVRTATPLGLTIAALVNSITVLVNSVGWMSLKFASQEGDSRIFAAQLRARRTMLVTSLFLMAMLTSAALAKDRGVALLLDATGAIYLSALMLANGLSLISRGLPHLLDSPAPADLAAMIRAAAARVIPDAEILAIRTRRSGPTTFAEVSVSGDTLTSVAELPECCAAIAEAVRDAGRDVEVTVVLASPPGAWAGV